MITSVVVTTNGSVCPSGFASSWTLEANYTPPHTHRHALIIDVFGVDNFGTFLCLA